MRDIEGQIHTDIHYEISWVEGMAWRLVEWLRFPETVLDEYTLDMFDCMANCSGRFDEQVRQADAYDANEDEAFLRYPSHLVADCRKMILARFAKPRVVVEIHGGCVQHVATTNGATNVEVVVVDWDNKDHEGGKADHVDMHYPVTALSPETEAVIDAFCKEMREKGMEI